MFNARLTALAGITLALSACNTATVPGSSGLTSGVWTPTGPIQVASVTGGPWTLVQNSATLGHSMAGYCDTYPTGKLQGLCCLNWRHGRLRAGVV